MAKHPLPASCAVCVFFLGERGHCRRHSPSPGHEEFELVFWPKVRAADRCGQGASISNIEAPGVTLCQACVHWHQPGSEPVNPDYRKGLSVEWWAESGYCTRSAPV